MWQVIRLKKLIIRCFGKICPRIWRAFGTVKLVVCSFCYNSHVDSGYVADTLLEPMFWFVDHFTQALGPIFVAMVIAMLTIYVLIAYVIGLPYWWNRNLCVTIIALILGNWLLINVIFHYYMALTTPPGYPPENEIIPEAVSICKKCIAPKPPRTHHCSVCNRCILKMDHHCPWLNNCVGFFNHRYFFMFCFYTWIGCIFVIVFGISIAYEHYFGEEASSQQNDSSDSSSHRIEFFPLNISSQITTLTNGSAVVHEWSSLSGRIISYLVSLRHSCIVFEILSTGGVFVAVGALMSWHAKLITKGETCVETHINKKERERLAKLRKPFKNPFDLGSRRNWRVFLGLEGRGLTWRHVLLPSRHPPAGDGLRWSHHYTDLYS
ncbi:putative palmitoyltransferase ZDHHC16-like protein [Dinothrombium tinctorium]|uniref:Palmitoyltransferase n=1 Tax=Dinothrombium tinctorium TaxID=1965070 RepID=A0A3S3P590_9ACAR|nr:putative palmitoyltransferase ZDHHC16-like protein [Dinothrombium tinctorium]RWS12373.1 putative palmitoyltransferase ZDHHC16-like protein [Dinothrombium tinctorium]